MAGQRIDYGSERQRHKGFVGRAPLLDQLDEPAFAADNQSTGLAFWERAAPWRGLDARFVDDVMARCDCNLAPDATPRRRRAAPSPAGTMKLTREA